MFKSADKWLPGYLRSLLARPRSVSGTRHLIFSVCDHYEPYRDGASRATARQIVRDWVSAYPTVVDPFRDADGLPPRHSFFYPQEEYDAAILDDLSALCRRGFGEVEIHLHHRHDTAEGLREKLVGFRDLLHQQHGLLGKEQTTDHRPQTSDIRPQTTDHRHQTSDQIETPEFARSDVYGMPAVATAEAVAKEGLRSKVFSAVRYAFIHGNWSLCNSRPDGDWCGVNEELGILADTGCYADFTFPSAPSPTQPRMVNAIYYATDTPGRPRAADRGVRVKTTDPRHQTTDHRHQTSDRIQGEADASRSDVCGLRSDVPPLLLVTGPLALNWRRRKWGIFPKLENADVSGGNLPTPDRVRLWADQQIGVAGRPDWVFVKVHTHSCVPANGRVILGEAMKQAHATLQREFNDGERWQLHYVTAREMHNLVKAAELNLPGPPGQYRDTPILWKP